MTREQAAQTAMADAPDRVRALATPPTTAPTDDHAAVWLEKDGGVWADYPTVPTGDHMLPLVWGGGDPVSRRDLEDLGCTFTLISWSL